MEEVLSCSTPCWHGRQSGNLFLLPLLNLKLFRLWAPWGSRVQFTAVVRMLREELKWTLLHCGLEETALCSVWLPLLPLIISLPWLYSLNDTEKKNGGNRNNLLLAASKNSYLGKDCVDQSTGRSSPRERRVCYGDCRIWSSTHRTSSLDHRRAA